MGKVALSDVASFQRVVRHRDAEAQRKPEWRTAPVFSAPLRLFVRKIVRRKPIPTNADMMVKMRLVVLCLLLAVLAGCAPPPAPPDPQLWGSLKPGPYAVGFGLRWETDPSRTYGLEKDG